MADPKSAAPQASHAAGFDYGIIVLVVGILIASAALFFTH